MSDPAVSWRATGAYYRTSILSTALGLTLAGSIPFEMTLPSKLKQLESACPVAHPALPGTLDMPKPCGKE